MKKQWMNRLVALMLAALVLCAPARAETFWDWLFEDAQPATEPIFPDATPAPEIELPDSRLTDDGWLRVYLRSMDTPSQLHLTLAGKYAVEGDRGFRFERGTELTLYIEDGELWLTDGHITLDMGLSMTLTRHATPEALNGLYIEEAEKPNLFCGDLSVTVTENGLRPVLRIQMEDYLRGVVAYEMSDSFPLEALKAQAVAARTYALRQKWAGGRRDYDVVDTTADQVYKGWDPDLMNVIAAVDATRGVVGVFDGGPAMCYYTASNGGQTALPSQVWGTEGGDGYLAMTDDPYDVENPASLQRDLAFSAECDGSLKLKEMLTDALSEVMAGEGYAPDAWAFDSIAAIEPVDPRFEGSRMCDGLAFDLRVRVAESAMPTPTPSAAPSEAPATVEGEMSLAPDAEPWVTLPDTKRVVLDVYSDIKDGLSMGLNDADCELISVVTELDEETETALAFQLVMRRFGHGVGMSQRGAQWMAGQYGKTFRDILEFYYPGMSVERMEWTGDALTTLLEQEEARGAARPRPTPTPSPAPLPQLKDGERYGTVASSTLNIRERPTTASRILDTLEQGARMVVCGEPDAEGWVPIRTGEAEGFVKAEYLEEE